MGDRLSGFAASNDDLGDIASSVEYIESDVRSLTEAWQADAGDASDVFATVESGEAFGQLHASVTTMLNDRADNCADLADKIRAGRSAYERIEDVVTETLDRIMPDSLGEILGGGR